MTITATIVKVYPEAGGQSKAGKTWRKQEVVAVYDNSKPEYPKSILFSVMNDNIEKLNLKEGLEYTLEIDFSTRDYQERTYMDASCWKATPTATTPE